MVMASGEDCPRNYYIRDFVLSHSKLLMCITVAITVFTITGLLLGIIHRQGAWDPARSVCLWGNHTLQLGPVVTRKNGDEETSDFYEEYDSEDGSDPKIELNITLTEEESHGIRKGENPEGGFPRQRGKK